MLTLNGTKASNSVTLQSSAAGTAKKNPGSPKTDLANAARPGASGTAQKSEWAMLDCVEQGSEKVWVNTVREKNIAALNAMLLAPPRNEARFTDKFTPLMKSLCSQGITFTMFYVAGGVLKLAGYESSQHNTVGLLSFFDIFHAQMRNLENLFLNRLFPDPQGQMTSHGSNSPEVLVKIYKELMEADSLNYEGISVESRQALKEFDSDCFSRAPGNATYLYVALFARQGLLKSLPTTVFDVSHQTTAGDPIERARIDRSIKTLIDRYPEEMRDGLRTFSARIRANCFKKIPQSAGAYLYGKPGTGKTYFARNLARALGIPLIEFSLQGATERAFFGSDDRFLLASAPVR